MAREQTYQMHGGPFDGPYGPVPSHMDLPSGGQLARYKIHAIDDPVWHEYRLRENGVDMDYVGVVEKGQNS